MRIRTTVMGCALLWASCGGAASSAAVDSDVPDTGELRDAALDELSRAAVSTSPDTAATAIEALRSRGPAGLRALMREHAAAIAALRTAPLDPSAGGPAARERLRHALDTVAAQRDAHASGLYWHTDLDRARARARERGVPILSLRLLGQLDEELSCANSRYFRVLLYSDPDVADLLREQFVLHWSSERPVPRVTIDMGDGRTLVRTLTGNSAHYVLDADGHPLDVLVGLDSPTGFVRRLRAARRIAEACDRRQLLGDGERRACLSREHRERRRAQPAWWSRIDETPFANALASLPGASPRVRPTAMDAMPLTESKSSRELPLLAALVGPGAARPPEPDWAQISARDNTQRPLHPWTLSLLRLKGAREDVDEVAAELRRRAAADGVRNELLFHRRIHSWFAGRRPETVGFEALNEAVYRELMQTPAADPWLGLDADGLGDAIEL